MGVREHCLVSAMGHSRVGIIGLTSILTHVIVSHKHWPASGCMYVYQCVRVNPNYTKVYFALFWALGNNVNGGKHETTERMLSIFK